jgi:4-amino-4-deoxy-L-arabinose transferase-like glycosyltransferase
VFTFLVAAAILVCSTAWPKPEGERRRWFLFSFVSALAVLTMGTPGLLLPIAGLLTSVWNGWRNPQVRAAATLYFSALALFVGVVLAWLAPAGLDYGFAPILRLFALQATRWESSALLTPSAHLLQHYLPFSLLLFPALWRVIRHPAADGGERSFERLLAAWLAVGLLIVSLIEQNAGDAVFALWPAGALLVGRELARLAERMGKTKFAGVAVVINCFLIGAIYNAAHSIGAASLATSPLARELQLARNAELAAGALKASGIDIHNLNHLNTPRTVQLYLGTFQPLIVRTELQALLASTDGPVDLALGAANIEELDIPARLAGTRQTFRWPEDPSQPPVLQVYRITR